MAALPTVQVSPEDYLALDRAASTKSEYIDGVMYAMAGTSENHEMIVAAMVAALFDHFVDKPCRVYPGNTKIRIPDRRKYLYPDIAAICGKTEFADDQRDVVLNPHLVVEVLSNSTASHDRTRKFLWYQQIEALEEYVLVSQDEPLVETYHRQSDGTWTYTKLDRLDAVMTLRSVNCAIPLKTVYSKVEFSPRASDDEDAL